MTSEQAFYISSIYVLPHIHKFATRRRNIARTRALEVYICRHITCGTPFAPRHSDTLPIDKNCSHSCHVSHNNNIQFSSLCSFPNSKRIIQRKKKTNFCICYFLHYFPIVMIIFLYIRHWNVVGCLFQSVVSVCTYVSVYSLFICLWYVTVTYIHMYVKYITYSMYVEVYEVLYADVGY